MTDETEARAPGKKASPRGCLTLAAIFLVVSLAGALATLMLFAFVVQDWGLIPVPREFGFDMILYAPLAGIACGFAATFWSTRGDSARRGSVLLGLGLVVTAALLLVFFGLGAIV